MKKLIEAISLERKNVRILQDALINAGTATRYMAVKPQYDRSVSSLKALEWLLVARICAIAIIGSVVVAAAI